MQDRLVLVTGATGYVGTVLVPLLARIYPVRTYDTETFGNAIRNTPNVEFIKGDIQDNAAVTNALVGVTDIIHLAGIVTDGLVDMNPAMGRRVNNDAFHWLCELACDANIRRLIYASSSSVYGTHLGMDEEHACTEDCEPKPPTEYAWTKLMGEYIVNQYEDNMTVVSIRSATASGPAPRMRLDTVVNTFCKQAYFDKVITVHDGSQWRSNIHVLDVANLYCYLLDVPSSLINGKVFNATAENHQVLHLARLVKEFIDTEIQIQDILDHRSYRMDAHRLAKELDWCPAHTIADAIMDNQMFFENGSVNDPEADILYNNRRMKDIVGKTP